MPKESGLCIETWCPAYSEKRRETKNDGDPCLLGLYFMNTWKCKARMFGFKIQKLEKQYPKKRRDGHGEEKK